MLSMKYYTIINLYSRRQSNVISFGGSDALKKKTSGLQHEDLITRGRRDF